ncbi:hypothetical protein L580_0067 [Serratia fonticola AU-P3(3)]|nr:hypothetical protein L580_0067 [Serratia fonticola AU-P3(3)]
MCQCGHFAQKWGAYLSLLLTTKGQSHQPKGFIVDELLMPKGENPLSGGSYGLLGS